jgi:hypothetical protein
MSMAIMLFICFRRMTGRNWKKMKSFSVSMNDSYIPKPRQTLTIFTLGCKVRVTV